MTVNTTVIYKCHLEYLHSESNTPTLNELEWIFLDQHNVRVMCMSRRVN